MPSTPWTLSTEPRMWQLSALDVWGRSLRGIVAVVTGAGKTTFAQMCMVMFRSYYPHGRFVVVVPTVALLDQWYVSLREDLLVPDSDIEAFSGDRRSAQLRLVNLMVVNTARTIASEVAREFDTMLIVDECHRAASESNSSALQGRHQATLGMSATPERQYDDGLKTVLVPALGPVVYRYSYEDAFRERIIVPFDLVNVETEMTRDERVHYAAATARVWRAFSRYKAGEVGRDVLVRRLQHRARLASTAVQRIPVAVRLVEEHRGSRMIVFHESVAAAEVIWKTLLAREIRATLYHSRIGPELRRDNLRLFRRGVFDVLVTCRAADEGVNIPETEVAVVASSTGSVRQRIQRLGRVLRPARRKSRATIYTIYVSKPEEDRLANEALNLQGVARVIWMRSSVRAGRRGSG